MSLSDAHNPDTARLAPGRAASLAGRVRAHPLVRAATAALERAGIDPLVVAASTDANAAFAAGIPAVSLGITVGAGEHTVEEWIDLRPIARGLVALADVLERGRITLSGTGAELAGHDDVVTAYLGRRPASS